MGLVEHLEKGITKTRTSFSKDKGKFVDYLMKYDLKNYFSDDVSEEEKGRLKQGLERKLESNLDKYDKELGGILRKTSSKGTMGLAIANDLYAYISNVPLANVTGLGYTLFAIKSVAETPAIYRYVKKSHDYYGAVEHLLLKPVRYLIPVVGAAFESGAFERMVRKRILKETKHDFIKEFGNYIEFEDRLKEKLKQPISDAIEERKKAA